MYRNWAGIIVTLAMLFACNAARASSTVQYSCDTRAGTFTILPYDPFSDGGQTRQPEKEFKDAPYGESNVKCRLGKYVLHAKFLSVSPQSHGMCMGEGAADVESLSIDNVELSDGRISIDWDCPGSPAPVERVVVRAGSDGVNLQTCTEQGNDAGSAAGNPSCTAKHIDVEKVAAAQARVDNQLADAETQRSQSATGLPSDNDLAKAFPAPDLNDTGAPLCAHWSETFLNAMTSPGKQRHGRIAGKKGDRIDIHFANPQLCGSPVDDGCKPRSYVIPGDRVDVGFICGGWTMIQYESRVRARPPIKGWVETARLYALDPLAVSPPGAKTVSAAYSSAPDPVVRAVARNDQPELKRLFASGASPDGAKKDGTPLIVAITADNSDLVRFLIESGANVNARMPGRFQGCGILTYGVSHPGIFDLLVKAHIDLNCHGGQFNSTELMNVAANNRLWNWEWAHDPDRPSYGQLPDPVAKAKRLIALGADVNAKDGFGRNALFYTMESNNVDVARVLIDAGIDVNAAIGPGAGSFGDQLGSTPLMNAFNWYALTLDPTMFRLLLEHGANANYRNESEYNEEWDTTTRGAVTFGGQTVLTRAAEDGYYTLARLALEHGADPAIPRQDGKLAETIARENKHPEIAELIARYERIKPSKRRSKLPGVQ